MQNAKCTLCSSRKNPYPSHGRSSEIPRGGGGVLNKILEANYEAKLEFPRGSKDAKPKTFCGGSMDIFWNCTFLFCLLTLGSGHVKFDPMHSFDPKRFNFYNVGFINLQANQAFPQCT